MKTVIEMAREAGLFCNELHCSPPIITWKGDEGNLERFAELVRADEREACARLAERSESGLHCAFAIRARSNT
jgi:hypothetical protein